MASSDDEEVVVSQSVTNYHFVDKDGVPISFSTLPLIIDDNEKVESPLQQVSVRGTMDGGLQSVFKDVIGWKLKMNGDAPEASVLSKDNKWIKLEKPKKSYEECIRTTLVTMHLLHFAKHNLEASAKSFWEYLHQTLSSFDDKPSQADFKDHMQVIKVFLERDETLAKSQILQSFIKNPEKAFVEDFHNGLEEKSFIDDELEDAIGIDEGEESDEESDLFDSVCSICDNGGELLCCEGRCLRSFHATRRAGADSDCASLGLTRIQVEVMQNFLCKNCQFKKHQCFACGKLGSSDKSSNAEVFSCVSATCGRFYHPKCVAELLFPENKFEATELGKRIAAGESFTCSMHRCIVCKQVENKEVEELQFAICRRCPKSYHRKCLPKEIAFEDIEDEDIIQRAWEGLLPNRILIYCLNHEIDEELGTPYRNHIIFPEYPEKKRETVVPKIKPKNIMLSSDRMAGDLKFSKPTKRPEKLADSDVSMFTGGKALTHKAFDSLNKLKILKQDAKPAAKKVELKEFTKSSLTKVRPIHGSGMAEVPNSAVAAHGKLINTVPKILPEIRKDVLTLVEEESSSLTQDDIRKMLSRPSTYSSAVGQIDKSITLGKIEGAIEAVRTALTKLEGGGNVEDAKAVCEPEILKRLIKWNVKLKVYLAPVLHGARYSSYGRHFTKFDKLQEIVDKLQWYVQDGDMIVDFCCGANEFSILMKEKLDDIGKKCLFKNYDILQAKNDFNFEMRDWMTVRPNELPTGSKLIMGLNPPFGLNARLANQFIDKALTFKPKLLILIVPEETRRLDTKNPQYDLVWEDKASLSGKSFYLPGSIDVHDKQIEQWNVKPPVLYLWSRPDWTFKHKGIASSQGHTSKMLPSLFIQKDSQVSSGENAPILSKNAEEKYIENDATQVEKENINMSLKQKGIATLHDHSSSEVDSTLEAQIEVEREEDAYELQETRKEFDGKKKNIIERSEKREVAPVQREMEREVHNKKSQLDRTEKKNAVLEDKVGRLGAGKKIAEETKKRKSSELPEDKNHKKKMLREQPHQQHLQRQPQQGDGEIQQDEFLPDMSISPSDRREPVNGSINQAPKLGVPDRESSHGGTEVRNMSSVGRPSGIHEDLESISRRYNTAERDSFYTNSPHNLSGTEVYGHGDERFRGYNSVETFCQSQYSVNGYGRAYSLQGDEVTNSYGRSSDTDLRPSYRKYGEEVSNGYGRPTELDARTQIKLYGEEDHPMGSRFAVGGSGSSLGQPSLYPSSSFRFSSPAAEAPAMQRYAPRLEEGYRRMSPGLPFPARDMHGMRRDLPPDSFGFTPGTSSFPSQGSFGGWVDD